jgi:glycosyltransferase involved in cell wall biosynthesis
VSAVAPEVGGTRAAGRPRVALVHDWLTGMRGGEKVLEAIAALYPEAPIYTLFHFPGSVSAALESHPIRTSFLQRAPFVRRRYRSYLPLFPAAIEDFDLSGFDVVISSSHCVAKGVVPPPDAFHLCYCHTPMRYAWDQEHAYFPRRQGVAARFRNLALSALRSWDASSAPRVHQFVANSRFVARRIATYYGREAEVAHPPVDVEFFTPGGSKAGYALVVSALAPYKKVEIAIDACEKIGMELRVIGDGPERERLAARAGRHTRLLGKVEGAELREQLRAASLFLQPGVEDFGIAPVEALACATPIVAAGRGGVLDIVESPADGELESPHGVLYPHDGGADAMAAAIDKARRIGFNPLEMRRRAEEFSASQFTLRIQSLLASGSRSFA